MKKSMASIALLGAATLVLAGCSSDSGDEEMVGGMAECTSEAMTEAVSGSYGEGSFVISDYKCEDGWAYASTDPAEGEQAAPRMFIFQAEGQFWIPKQAADVCGTFDDGAFPADATIPESLYDPACLVG